MAMPEPRDDFGFWESVKDKSIDTLWPPDSEYVAWDLAAAWTEAAALMEATAKSFEDAGKRLPDAWFDIAGIRFTDAVNSMPANYTNLAANMKLLADGAKAYGDQLREARISIIWELAVNIGLFVALSWLPGGGFLAAALSRAVAGRLTAMITGMAGRAAAGFAKLSVEVAKESFDEAFNNTATQLTSMLMGSRKEFNGAELRDAALTGGVGGILGEGLGKTLKAGNTAARKVMPSLPTAPASGVARNLNAGFGASLNNAVTSPTAGYITENWGNFDALTDLSGYGKAISDGGLAAGLAGAPRSMAIDLVQQRNPDHAAQADALADRRVGTSPPPPDGGPPGDGELSGGPGTQPSAGTDQATAPERQTSPDGAPVADASTTDNGSTADRSSEAERSTAPPGSRGADLDTGGRTTTHAPARGDAPAADHHPGETERRAAPATGEQQKTSAPQHSPSEETTAPSTPADTSQAADTATDPATPAPADQAQSAPTQANPTQANPTQTGPTQEAQNQQTPSQQAPAQQAPIASGTTAPVHGAPAPTQAAPVHSSSASPTTSNPPGGTKKAPTNSESAPEQTNQESSVPEQAAPEATTSEPTAPEAAAPEAAAPEQAAPELAASEQSTPGQSADSTPAPQQVTATPAGAVMAAAAAAPAPTAPQQETKPRSAPTHTKVTAAPPRPPAPPSPPGRPSPEQANQRHAEATPAGVSHHGGDPNMGDLPHKVPNDPNHFTADVHITPDGKAHIGGHEYTAAEYAAMLRSFGYDGSKPVRLIGCDAASNDFASQLSKHLNAPVVAPTKLAWTDAGGRVFTSDPETGPDGTRRPKIPPTGQWTTHHPDGSKSKASDDGYAPGTQHHNSTDTYGARDRAADDTNADGNSDERPDHVDNNRKLTDWIYGGRRPDFSAETKSTVYSRAEMNKDGEFICATSGKPIPVQTKADGTTQFHEMRGDPPRTCKTDPPDWYRRWKEEGIEPSPADLQPPHDRFPKPMPNAAHLGHLDEAEYWRQVQFALYHHISAEDFKKIYDHPDHYRLESKAANESHAYESKSHGYGYYDQFVQMPHPDHPDEPKFPPLPNAPDPDDIYKGRPKPGK